MAAYNVTESTTPKTNMFKITVLVDVTKLVPVTSAPIIESLSVAPAADVVEVVAGHYKQ